MIFHDDRATVSSNDSFGAVGLQSGLEVKSNMLASANVRIGYAVGDFLLFGTAGGAYTQIDAKLNQTATFKSLSLSSSQSKSTGAFGAVFGGGLSYFVSDNAALSLEGQYYKFDKAIGFDGSDTSANLDDAFSVMTKFIIRVN